MASDESIKVLRRTEVEAKLGLSRSTIYELLNSDSDFPRPIKLGRAAVGWIEFEVDAWLKQQMEKRKRRPELPRHSTNFPAPTFAQSLGFTGNRGRRWPR